MIHRKIQGIAYAMLASSLLLLPTSAIAAPKQLPDLVVANATLTVKNSGLQTGDKFVTAVNMRNAGDAASPRATVGIYLSKDAKVGKGDLLVGSGVIKALRAKSAAQVRITSRAPKVKTRQGYQIIVVADYRKKIKEARETNNTLSLAGKSIVSRDYKLMFSPRNGPAAAPLLEAAQAVTAAMNANDWNQVCALQHPSLIPAMIESGKEVAEFLEEAPPTDCVGAVKLMHEVMALFAGVKSYAVPTNANTAVEIKGANADLYSLTSAVFKKDESTTLGGSTKYKLIDGKWYMAS